MAKSYKQSVEQSIVPQYRKTSGSILKDYQIFKKVLLGFTEVTLTEFRDQIMPLKDKFPWDKEDEDYITSLIDAGAGCSLQTYFGEHAEAKRVFGPSPLAPEPMDFFKLESHMRALIKQCRVANWNANDYSTWLARLHKTAEEREEERLAAVEVRKAREAAGEIAKTSQKDEPEPRDYFAEMYRGAGPAFKKCVEKFILEAMWAEAAKADAAKAK